MEYTKKPNVSVRRVADEVFVLDRDTSVLHTFNSTGAFLWERVAVGRSMDEMADDIAKEYEVGADQAREDVFQFLLKLKKSSLIKVVP